MPVFACPQLKIQHLIIFSLYSNVVLLCSARELHRDGPRELTVDHFEYPSSRESWGREEWNRLKWGFATSAYQIEGAWDVDGKGPSIWDNFTHRVPSPVKDGSNGDMTCDSYHRFKEDIILMANLKAQVYRFSMSWSRLLPNGTKESFDPNGSGVLYYNSILDELKAHNIEPIVGLNHFDLPQALEDLGGFLNESLIVNSFSDYAELAFTTFGKRIKNWITFNEPWVQCVHGYETGLFAPGKLEKDPKKGALLCGHNLLKAHATAYRLYQNKFKSDQGGRIGLSLFAPWFENYPWLDKGLQNLDENESDGNVKLRRHNEHAAELARQEVIGWFAQPVMQGTYPKALNEIHGKEKVHKFSRYWTNMINGSVDFLGINHYTTFLIVNGSWYSDDKKMEYYSDPTSPVAASKWLRSEPHGIRSLLYWLKKEYDNPTIYITENGFSDLGDSPPPQERDYAREMYLRKYLDQIKLAVVEDHVDVQVYTVWSLLDNFEFISGYTERFGVFWVDFNNPNRTRIAKSSACLLDWIFNRKRSSGVTNQPIFQNQFLRQCRHLDFELSPRLSPESELEYFRIFQALVFIDIFMFLVCVAVLISYSLYRLLCRNV